MWPSSLHWLLLTDIGEKDNRKLTHDHHLKQGTWSISGVWTKHTSRPCFKVSLRIIILSILMCKYNRTIYFIFCFLHLLALSSFPKVSCFITSDGLLCPHPLTWRPCHLVWYISFGSLECLASPWRTPWPWACTVLSTCTTTWGWSRLAATSMSFAWISIVSSKGSVLWWFSIGPSAGFLSRGGVESRVKAQQVSQTHRARGRPSRASRDGA